MDFPKFFDDRLPPRFWEKCRHNNTTGCWEWVGGKNEKGYGLFHFCGRVWKTHRLIYEKLVGQIPQGLQIDHLCRVRHCANPSHLEPVTQFENQKRSPFTVASISLGKTHCPRGHPYSPENTRRHSIRGERMCIICTRAAKNRYCRKPKKMGATP